MVALRGIAAMALLSFTPLCGAEDWRPLFNGKDLEGWTPKIRFHEVGENFANTFRVEEGLLKVRYDDPAKEADPNEEEGYGRGEVKDFGARFGHLFYNETFSHYRLRVEYRLAPDSDRCPGGADWARRNSGVMIHGQSPQSMTLDQQFPVSIEVQLLGGLGQGPRSTANLCTPGTLFKSGGVVSTQHCTNSTSPTFDEGWVTVEIEAHGGGAIRHYVNGTLVMEYTEPQLDPADADAKRLIDAGAPLALTGGTISLQSESSPVDFRKVEILELEATK